MENILGLHKRGYDVDDVRPVGTVAWTNGRNEARRETFENYYVTRNGCILSCWRNGIDGRWKWQTITIRDGHVKMKPGTFKPAMRVPVSVIFSEVSE